MTCTVLAASCATASCIIDGGAGMAPAEDGTRPSRLARSAWKDGISSSTAPRPMEPGGGGGGWGGRRVGSSKLIDAGGRELIELIEDGGAGPPLRLSSAAIDSRKREKSVVSVSRSSCAHNEA